MKKTINSVSRLCLLTIIAITAQKPVIADVRLPAVFSDNMVLQRQKDIPVWGQAEAGEEVTVSFMDRTASATADKNGKWIVRLEPVEAGGPFTMVVSGKNRIVLTNVMAGEVWLCSGQSNMEWNTDRVVNAAQEIKNAHYKNIRLFKIDRRMSRVPLDDVQASWYQCTQNSVDDFSAVGYFFGRYIHKELDVPVGLICAAWGGTMIEPWIPKAGFEQNREFSDIVKMINGSQEEYMKILSKTLDEHQQFVTQARKDLEAGRNVTEPPAWPKHPLEGDKQTPTCLFNGMISPVIPFAIRGVLWYQGESNCIKKDGMKYYEKCRIMLSSWRKLWGQGDFSFYYVQLAPFIYGNYKLEPTELPRLWEAQTACLQLPNTGMAVTVDIGDINDIHPKNKQDVGKRLALWALAKDYGKNDIVYSGPLYKSMKVEGEKIRVSFDHTAAGLKSRDGKDPSWFEIAGEDKKFCPAKAVIDSDTVLVSSTTVTMPVAVRFAWNQAAQPDLMNSQGLPASPFRTDKW